MDPIKNGSGSVNNFLNNSNQNNSLYYGVYTPNDLKDPFNAPVNVFQDKLEALKLAKKNKKSRFKAFHFYHEAAEFSMNGSECPNNNTTVDGPLFQNKISDQPQSVGEKASPFKGPKPQELVELRKGIENGNYKFVFDTIWQNPRYLVSSGDTPSILQEGPRYNALHVAAKSKNAEITEMILNTISNVEFVKLLYGDDNQENAEERTKMLLDLYLNTPNKGVLETPLHFASKYGSAEVTEILVSYPQCDKTLKNKFMKTADQIVCERADFEDKSELTAAKKKIAILLQDSYYVPVLRTEDNTMPPLIGQPFSPTSPPVLNRNPMSPRLEIHAYAGPMDKAGAEKFRKIWKTPPRNISSPISSKTNKSLDSLNVSELRFKDPEKGLERIGKNLAKDMDVTWKEYWPFLSSFVDIASTEGLQLLEKHLGRGLLGSNSPIFSKNTTKNSIISLSPNKSDIISPMTNLCKAFQNINLNDSYQENINEKSRVHPLIYIDKACQVFANRIANDILYICAEYNNISNVLETEVKQLELLITSYMEDNRFSQVNFQKIHSRLGQLICEKLMCQNVKDESRISVCRKLENLQDNITKSLDYFSSDDEGNYKLQIDQKKPTTYKKQLICLVHYIIHALSQNPGTTDNGSITESFNDNENECGWDTVEDCACTYHVRKSKKNCLSRSGSLKNKFWAKTEDTISRKLFFDEEQIIVNNISNCNDLNGSIKKHLDNSSSDEDEEDKFYTPPSSPSLIESDPESEDEFNDTELPKNENYIEGDMPTKTDLAVFNALKFADCQIDERMYPNIYRWRHNIGLYPDDERESWMGPNDLVSKIKKNNSLCHSPNVSLSTSWSNDSPKCSTPSKSWIRITGANSPMASFKNFN